jgi:hypothetical protein
MLIFGRIPVLKKPYYLPIPDYSLIKPSKNSQKTLKKPPKNYQKIIKNSQKPSTNYSQTIYIQKTLKKH